MAGLFAVCVYVPHHRRRSPSGTSCCSRCSPRLLLRLHPQYQPGYSWALTPGCHLSCSPCSADRNSPPVAWLAIAVLQEKMNLKVGFFCCGRVSWLHTKGTGLQKQVLGGRTALFMPGAHVVLSSLLLTSLPLRCTSSPPAARAATESAVCHVGCFFVPRFAIQ